jgi:WhiB family redox-sensing transcriptional regulator
MTTQTGQPVRVVSFTATRQTNHKAKTEVAGQLELPLTPELPLPMRVTVNSWITRDWRDRAACTGTENPAFYSDNPTDQTKAAQEVCGSCPVRRSCLATALLHDEQGVWGGTTETDREAITTTLAGLSAYWMRRAPSALPAACRTEWSPGPHAHDPTKPLPIQRRGERPAA